MAKSNPFSLEIDFEYGVATPLSPLVRRFVANNPGALTFKGTNIYVLGQDEVALIDAGPDDEVHIQALLKALRGESISKIFLTHTHKDHSGAIARLQQLTGAKTYGFRLGEVVRGAYRQSKNGHFIDCSNGEPMLASDFADMAFRPDHLLDDGDEITGKDWTLRAVHTPGHAPDHICYSLLQEKALFTGDQVMPWSTSVIAPPEGDMKDYMASLECLISRNDELYLPGHGGRVKKPKRLVRAYILHRQWREKSILKAVAQGSRRVDEIVPLLYTKIDEDIRSAAALSVLAHLLHLVEKDKLQHIEGEGLEACFELLSR